MSDSSSRALLRNVNRRWSSSYGARTSPRRGFREGDPDVAPVLRELERLKEERDSGVDVRDEIDELIEDFNEKREEARDRRLRSAADDFVEAEEEGEVDGDEGGEPDPDDDEVENDERCCVKDFSYPVPRSVAPLTDGRSIGFEFFFGAAYKKGGDCACHCCVFQQFARLQEWYWFAADADTGPKMREDCDVVTKDKKSGREINHGSFVDGVTAGPDQEYACVSPQWNGARSSTGVPVPGGLGKTGINETDTTCEWFDRDTPFVVVPPLQGYNLKWTFTGVVRDSCKNDEIRAIDSFWYNRFGFVGVSGEIDETPLAGGGRADADGSNWTRVGGLRRAGPPITK